MRETIKETVERVVRYCDMCGASAVRRTCSICEADVCDKHVVWDPADDGDYPGTFCRRCWDGGADIWAKIRALCNCCQFDEREALRREWRARFPNPPSAPPPAAE